MPKRNSLGQFMKTDDSLVIKLPGPIKLLKIIIVFFALSPWLFVLLYRIDIKQVFKDIMEFIFGYKIADETTKKSNGFF